MGETIGATPSERHSGRFVPTAWAVSRWWDDPYSRGGWSLLRVGASPDTRRSVGEPVNSRLILAGEATHPEQAGMTHGAYEEGLRAAEWSLAQGHRNVVVVGAGMAGLSAARHLQDAGVNCVVIEARKRIGGRIDSTPIGGEATGELGANWLQQGQRNTLRPLAKKLGLQLVPTDFNDPTDFATTRPGQPLKPPSSQLFQTLNARMSGRSAPEDCSIQSVLDQWLADPKGFEEAEIQRIVDSEIYLDSGAPLEDLSARFGFEPGVGEGDDWIVGGYGQLVAALQSGACGDDRSEPLEILLATPVSAIHTYQTHVQVGSETGWATNADAVIVTAPIAVLKRNAITFRPPLPHQHQSALALLTAGRVEKVVLQFAERFWAATGSHYIRIFGDRQGCVSEWLDQTDTVGTPTITGLFVGPWLDDIWGSPDETPRHDDEIALAAAAILRTAHTEKPHQK